MKIYIVHRGEYADREFVGAFSSLDKAANALKLSIPDFQQNFDDGWGLGLGWIGKRGLETVTIIETDLDSDARVVDATV